MPPVETGGKFTGRRYKERINIRLTAEGPGSRAPTVSLHIKHKV